MADLTEAYAALQKADAAGNTADAKQLADYIRAQSSAAPTDSTQPASLGAGDIAKGIGETALHLGTGLIAAPAAGLAGLATMAGRGLGLTQADPADVVNQTQSALTYDPKSAGGQAVNKVVSYLPEKFAGLADAAGQKVSDATGSPAAGTAVDTAIQGLPLMLGAKLPLARGGAAATIAPEVADATAAGFRLTPEQAGGGIVGRAVQSLSGSAKLERSLSKKNAPVVNEIAANEIGIPGQQLTPANIKAAKAPANAIYDQVSKVGQVPTDAQYANDIAGISNRTGSSSFGFDVPPGVDRLKSGYGSVQDFDAGDAVAKVRQLRSDASKNVKAPNDPEKNALGYAQKQVAEAIENQLERHIQAKPGIPPDLINQFRQARVQLAKIHSVDDALDGSNISAKALAKQQDRGVPLSGGLKTIADAASNFDRSFQDISKIRDGGPFSVLDGVLGGAAYFHPGLAASALARPLARAALGSKAYQRVGIQGAPLSGAPSFPGLLGAPTAFPLLNQQQQGLLGSQ